jgi:hypothetical protein
VQFRTGRTHDTVVPTRLRQRFSCRFDEQDRLGIGAVGKNEYRAVLNFTGRIGVPVDWLDEQPQLDPRIVRLPDFMDPKSFRKVF